MRGSVWMRALAGALLLSTAATARAEDFSSARVVKKWKVTLYRGNGYRPGQSPATALPEGGIGMAFTTPPNTAQLTTTDRSYQESLLGDLTGATVHAEVGIVDAFNPVFNFYPDGCSAPANVRLYFRTKQNPLGESQYWWSNPASVSLADLAVAGDVGFTFDVALAPALWSDRAGHFGSEAGYTAFFEQAVADVEEIGVSFGGGCHFAFGVGVESGSATFQLRNFSVLR